MFEFFYKRPYLLFSTIALFFVMGVIGLVKMPKNLFPDSEYPTVVVITKIPGATAKVAASTVSKPIEEEISRLSLIRDISSVNVPNFSIIKAEFGYKKGLEAAAVDVSNALSIAKAKLPPNANPAVYTVGSFTLPVDVVALSPKNKNISLKEIRKIADSFIKPYLLSDHVIGNVEVFGGYKSAININIDPLKMKKYQFSFAQVFNVLRGSERDIPMGFIKGKNGFFTLTIYGEKDRVSELKRVAIAPNIMLKDIATVNWSEQKRTSGYIGNSKEAIALAIQRAPGGSVLDVSNEARAQIKKLQKMYPNIDFSISDTQRILIKTANTNMLEALRDAIIYTLLVLMFFLGNFRAIIAAGLSIPMVFFGTMAVIYLSGGELNIVIYTAIILALGMLVDDAVVVLENIERHLSGMHQDLQVAIKEGTREVLLPIFAGTVATIAIMFPLMFVGGFPQKIFRPLISTLIIALLVSYFLSITFIPKLSTYLYKNGTQKTKVEKWFEWFYQNTLGRLIVPYEGILKFSNGRFKPLRRFPLVALAIVIFILSLKNIMPLIGKDTMPPMDTGIMKAQIAFSTNDTVEDAEKRLKPFLKWLKTQKNFVMSSIAFGSESGVLSLGSGNLPTEATITINAVNRFQRKKSIWQMENEIRDKLHELKGIKRADVFDFGATALSSIKAPLDIRVKSATFDTLPQKAKEIQKAISKIKGLTSTSISWDKDFSEIEVVVDKNRALSYGLTPFSIMAQIPIKGQIASLNANLTSMDTQFVRIYLHGKFNGNIESLKLLPLHAKGGDIPLSAVAKVRYRLTEAKIERDKMLYSIDINGYRAKRAITHLTDDANKALSKIDKTGYIVTQEGDISSLNDSFYRMIKAIGIGIVVLLLTLISIYHSVRLSLIMIVVLPLSMIGAAWAMLIFDKPSCMPSLVGILLLFGIIIKNAVLLVDFFQEYRKEGNSPFESALKSVSVRFRPVMMTAFGTIAGMIPIALEQAVGLERLSPLADVAVGGLIVGTFLTLIYVPMFAYIFDKEKKTDKIKTGEENG